MAKQQDTIIEKPLRVAIAAGGTGGHIMPAIALGQALENIGHPVEVEYLCGNRDVERDIYAQSGVQPRIFPIGSISSGGKMRRAWQGVGLGYAFLRSLLLMRRFDLVVGMGGYITAPVLSAARFLRRPFILHDSNTVLGRVNAVMAPQAAMLALGMPLVAKPENVEPANMIETGTPVCRDIARGDRTEAAQAMYFDPDAFTLFIHGGSQGARGLNNLVARMLDHLTSLWPEDRALQILWITGPKELVRVREALRDKALRGRLWLAPIVERMEHVYAMADLALCRVGGSSLAERLVCGLPSILVPLPHAAGNHQRHNAAVLEQKGAALVVEQDQIEAEELARMIVDLSGDTDRLSQMSEDARRLSCPDAARDLARIVVEVGTGVREKAGSPDSEA